LARERRSLDILSVKKEARLSARALAEVKEGKVEEDLRCRSVFIVCKRRRDYQKMKRLSCFFERKNKVVVALMKRSERGPISAFPDVFSVANFRLKSAESGSEPSVGFRFASGDFW